MTPNEMSWHYPVQAVDEQAVSAVEAALGVRFPDDYRAFLRAYQGGVPIESDFDLNDPRKREVAVGAFLGVDEAEETKFIPIVMQDLGEQIEARVIPIADTGSGDFVMLDLRGAAAKVVYWHHERNEGDEYTHLADSFEGFIGLLYAPDWAGADS